MSDDHVGGWAQIVVWVQHPEGMDPPDHKTYPDHPIEKLFDVIADAAIDWSEEYKIDPYISGTLNEDPPDWAQGD